MKSFIYLLFTLLSTQLSAQDYIIKIAGMPPGNVDYESAKHAKMLSVDGPDDPQIIRFRITHHTSYMDYSATSYSASFTKEQLEIMAEMYRNSKLYVDKIRIKAGDRILDLPAVTFKLSTYDALNLIKLGGVKGGKITKQSILNDPYIRLSDNVGTVISFSLSCNQPADIEYTTNSDELTEQMLNAIKKASPGWSFWISNVKIKKEDGSIITANTADFRLY